ncbi:hypothetical protein [Desulfonatronovibrio hydrogenovorans]|uniref:hypothetical protein n=1 Tax=Desulfonatronovibrio hydrogenovorans TaxID=53245 RepID=UPI00048E50A6|nr:hypothetical protein [Desulfonatronovibrio hydrogenovorans]
MNKASFFSIRFLLHGVLLLAIAGLGLDLYLRISSGASLCPTQACAIVGDYVRLGETALVSLGLAFFALLWGVYFFASRYESKWLWVIATLLLLGALAFDGGLLGFQFFSIQENCLLCIAVGAGLILALILVALVRKKLSVLILGLAVWAGGGLAGAMITIPDRAPFLEQLSSITWSGPEAGEWPRFHYFFSLHCPHCTEVLLNLAVNEPREYVWNLYPLDTADPDLKKISWVMDQDLEQVNLFLEIVRLEQSGTVPDTQIRDGLEHKVEQARAFFRGSGFRGVPLMIVDEGPGKRVVLTGGSGIINYLLEQGVLAGGESSQ